MIVFKYKEESVGSGKETIQRPVADVALQTASGEWIEFHPYIDSGADLTMIPLSFGRLLGWHADEDAVEEIGGVRGSVPVVYQTGKMMIGDIKLSVKVAWALIEEVPPLLGRSDIFDAFTVLFKQKEGVIEFREATQKLMQKQWETEDALKKIRRGNKAVRQGRTRRVRSIRELL